MKWTWGSPGKFSTDSGGSESEAHCCPPPLGTAAPSRVTRGVELPLSLSWFRAQPGRHGTIHPQPPNCTHPLELQSKLFLSQSTAHFGSPALLGSKVSFTSSPLAPPPHQLLQPSVILFSLLRVIHPHPSPSGQVHPADPVCAGLGGKRVPPSGAPGEDEGCPSPMLVCSFPHPAGEQA